MNKKQLFWIAGALLAVCAAFYLIACGGGGNGQLSLDPGHEIRQSQGMGERPELKEPVVRGIDEIEQQISAFASDELDPGLVVELKTELSRVISSTASGTITNHAPSGISNSVNDLASITIYGEPLLIWSEANQGDYNGDGIVSLADLSVIGANWQVTVADPQWQDAKIADGNADGVVNLADVTPVGQNYLSEVSGYYVYRDSGNHYEYIGYVERRQARSSGGEFVYYFPVEAGTEETTYMVRPYCGSQDEPGTESTELLLRPRGGVFSSVVPVIEPEIIQIEGEQAEVSASTVLVNFDTPPTVSELIETVYSDLGGVLISELPSGSTFRVQLAAHEGRTASSVMNAAVASSVPNATVEYEYLIEPAAIPNDPLFPGQWSLDRIAAADGWRISSGADVRIGVVDTGVRQSHEELYDQLEPGFNTINGSGDVTDETGHGTAVTGVIAAAMNNQAGLAGLAPEAAIVPIKAGQQVGAGQGEPQWRYTTTDLVVALDWAINAGDCDVVNMSLSSPGSLGRAFEAKLEEAESRGVVVVGSAGNSASSAPHYPAAYPSVLAVAATDKDDARAAYSNYGFWVDVCAPGGRNDTADEGLSSTGHGSDNDYGYYSGTSMSCALATALAALLKAEAPTLTPGELRSLVRSSGESPADPYIGQRINAFRALRRLDDGVAVSGYVRDTAGQGLPNIELTLSGADRFTTRTGMDGSFRIAGVLDGNYTLAPGGMGLSFQPAQIPVTVSGEDIRGIEFIGEDSGFETYSIRGSVTDGYGAPVPGAELVIYTIGTAVTDAAGNYHLTAVPTGNYTLIPMLEGHAFEPPYAQIGVDRDLDSVDFTAEPAEINPDAPNTVSGFVTRNGAGLGGVTVNLTGDAVDNTTTSGAGYYEFTGLIDGTFTITPAPPANVWQFDPVSINTGFIVGNSPNNDFWCETIGGNISQWNDATGVGGVTVGVSGGVPDAATNLAGNFTTLAVPGAAYTITPSLAGWTFAPASQAANVPGSQSGVDFTAYPTGSIEGTVRENGVGLAGATISIPGYPSVASGPGGTYTLPNVEDGTYTVTCTFAGQTFGSNPRAGVVVAGGAATTNVDFDMVLYTLAGSINMNSSAPHGGEALPGIQVDLTGSAPSAPASDTTDATGAYSFDNLRAGNYTITADNTSFTYTPGTSQSRSTPPTDANVDFTATPRGSVSGQITRDGSGWGNGGGSVLLTLTGSGGSPSYTYTTFANAAGNFSFSNVLDDNYTLTPSLNLPPVQTFTPANLNPAVANGGSVTNQDFAIDIYEISGSVFLPAGDYAGNGYGGLDVEIQNGADPVTATRTTAADGSYTFGNLLAGNYDIVPTPHGGFSYAPASYPGVTVGPNVAGRDFVATPTGTISGYVHWPGHGGLDLTDITLVRQAAAPHDYTLTTATDAAGNYSYSNVLDGTWVVTPARTEPPGHTQTFTNASETIVVAGPGNTAVPDFTVNTYTISGNINRACDTFTPTGIVTVSMDATGAYDDRSLVLPGSGNYSFTNVLNDDFTITPSHASFDFDPVNRSITVAGANRPGQNFSGLRNDDQHNITVTIVTQFGIPVQNCRLRLTGTNTRHDGATHWSYSTPGPIPADAIGGGAYDANYVTDVNGQVTFSNLDDGCTYTIAQLMDPNMYPDPPGTAWSYPNQNYTLTHVISDRNVTIQITKNWFDVNGWVTDNSTGVGMNGVTIDLVDTAGTHSVTVTTNNYPYPGPLNGTPGYYEILSVPNGEYWLIPSNGPGWGFNPTQREVLINEGDWLDQNFEAFNNAYTASGYILDESGAGVAGVTVEMDPHNDIGPAGTTTTAADGYFEFTGVIEGWHIFRPELINWSFMPSSQLVWIDSDTDNIDFTGTDHGPGTIQGFVTRPNDSGIGGVTMELDTGTEQLYTSTDGTGFYIFTDLAVGGTLTPSRSGFSFTPASVVAAVDNTYDFEGE